MNASVKDTAARIKREADEQAALLPKVDEASALLYTAPDENRSYWQGEMEGYRRLKIELQRYAHLCAKAERALAKGLKRRRWGIRA